MEDTGEERRLHSKSISAVLILAVASALGFASVEPVSAQTGYGPRSPDLVLRYFDTNAELYASLTTGAIDISFSQLTPAQYANAITDPAIILCPVPRLDLVAFSLNNNVTIAAYPGRVSVTSVLNFRKALWCMVDRTYYTQVICGGLSTPVYVPVAAPSRSWVNVTAEEYVRSAYAYSIQVANSYLDAGGFAQIPGDTNPYYNPAVPGSAQYWRSYPSGFPNAGQRIDPVIFSARVDDACRIAASVELRDRMLMSGIPVNFIAETSRSAYSRVILQRNYQIYSADWSTGRFATCLHSWFHTSRWGSVRSNYHVSATSPGYALISSNPGAYPSARPEDYNEVDYYASQVWYPPSQAVAVTAALRVQGLATQRYATFIPLWSRNSFYAYRNLYGVTSMQGYGPENVYTFLSARTANSLPLTVGLLGAPYMVNQIYSSCPQDVSTMGLTMDDFMSLNPYDLLTDQPWLAQDWTSSPGGPTGVPGTWTDPDTGLLQSCMRFWFRDDPNDGLGDRDAEWIQPGLPAAGGGTVLADFTPQWLGGGYEFNCWYYDTEPAGWLYNCYRDIKHIVSNPAGNYADVYFDAFSFWSQYWSCGRLLYSVQPSSINQIVLGWKSNPLSEQRTRNFVGPIASGTYLNTLTPIGGDSPIPTRARGTPVEVISMTIDGVPATRATTPHLYDGSPGSAGGDYSIVGSSLNGPRIRVFNAIPAGSILTVTYWARGDPGGYWPGSTNFQTALIGTGPYYMTSYQPGVGGYATYKANQDYFIETPPEGEIDWYWYWIAGMQPLDGYYRVDIFDAANAAFALDGSGKYIPTVDWLPASDLVPPLGETDVSDIALLLSNYLVAFGSPLPNPPPP